MHAVSSVVWSVLVDYALRIPIQWLVRALVLTSMTLQLVLVVLGAYRYFISSRALRLMVWGAYISADAVAISALGTMMHNVRSGIYAIWAPVLLMHLGGPDAITAYSMADNELWLRHGFNMVYQLCVAVYVIYAAALRGPALASAIILLFVGFIKYGERTLALRLASYSQIVMSSLSISKYMERENVVDDHGYVIMGEDQLLGGEGIEAVADASSFKIRGVVTMKAVEEAGVEETDRNICLSHALFKMYKRRFGSLPFVEGDRPKTRDFWVHLGADNAFQIVEMELKFIYDALFSKYSGTAFSKWGMVVRVLNTILMGAAGFLILRDNQSRQAQGTVTYVVISVALAVEVFQLWRVIVSDWTRVWLICARVATPRNLIKSCRSKVVKRYWSNRIPQHCLIETWLNRFPFMWKAVGFLPKTYNLSVSCYIELGHIHEVSAEKELKNFIFAVLKETCPPDASNETFRQNVYNFEELYFAKEDEIRVVLDQHGNLEEAILMWHIATTICDRKRELNGEDENEHVRCSKILSRYCAYLLLSRPHLLPVHPKMARTIYMQLVQRLLSTLTLDIVIRGDPLDLLSNNDNNALGSGAKLAGLLLSEGLEERRWKLLAGYWGRLLIYIAVYNKATYHAECLAAGGEFLSHLWVLLAHMGCGEQSDFAVTKKIEMSSEKELFVTKKRSRESDEELAATAKILRDRDEELVAARKTVSDRDQELAATRKTVSDRDQELATTRKIVRDRDEELAATRKFLNDRDEEITVTMKVLRDREQELDAVKHK